MPSQPTPVYQWYQFEDIPATSKENIGFYYNPPFFAGPVGVMQPYMTNGPILRGYVKRAEIAGSLPQHDPGAVGRCYFMLNPTSLSQAWNWDLDTNLWGLTAAADQSITPAGIAAFQFALVFNREIECAHNIDHRGVLVDIDMLSYIIRGVPANLAGTVSGAGVHAGSVNAAAPSVPADPSGVFIGQGQLIDAVFSPYLTVRGQVTSLGIDYAKFTHRMVPTVCTVNIGMQVQAQSVGTQQIDGQATPPTQAQGTAGNSDPNNRYGNGGGT